MVEVVEPSQQDIDAEIEAARADVTGKQITWCEKFLGPARFNASLAARLTGISESEGRRYKLQPKVMRYLYAVQADRAKRWGVSKALVMEEIVALAFSDVTDLFDMTEGKLIVRDLSSLPRHVTGAIKKLKLKRQAVGDPADNEFEEVLEVEFHEKIKPLMMLGQAFGIGDDPDADKEMVRWTGVEILPPADKEDAK